MSLTYDDPTSRVQYAYRDPEPDLKADDDCRTWFKCVYEVFHKRTAGGLPVARRNIWIKALSATEATSLVQHLVECWKLKAGHEWDYKILCE
jgi:hypothetical protein